MSKQNIIVYDQSYYSKNKINCLYIYIPHPYFKSDTTQKLNFSEKGKNYFLIWKKIID